MSSNPECGQDASVLLCVLNTTAAKELKKLKMQDYRSEYLQWWRISYTALLVCLHIVTQLAVSESGPRRGS